jgi:hypothetical protein
MWRKSSESFDSEGEAETLYRRPGSKRATIMRTAIARMDK